MKEDSTERDTEKKTKETTGLNTWLIFLYVLTSPLSGWRKLKSTSLTGNEFAAKLFYPLLALTSLTVFANLIYEALTLQELLTKAIICFASIFFSYFIIQMAFRVCSSGELMEALTGKFGQKFCMTSLSSLCIYLILYNFVPMLEDILVFFPIYTVYLIFKGLPSLLLPRMRTQKSIALVVCLNILVPVLLYLALGALLTVHSA